MRNAVIVGAGQVVERIGAAGYAALPAAELAARAARAALADSGAEGLRPGLMAAVRTFEDSGVGVSPLGRPDRFPLAVARRLGLTPATAIYGPVGGDSPAALLVELGARIVAGEADAALLVGAEAISTTRHLLASEAARPDWAEQDEGVVDDRGADLAGLFSPAGIRHGLVAIPAVHGLLENARRARLGLSRAGYAAAMGELFAPFSATAADNPMSAAALPALTADELVAVTERNRLVADPYPLRLVARDQVNQGAALLVMEEGAARALGLDPARFIYLAGAAQAASPDPLARAELGAYPAADVALAAALDAAGCGVAQMDHFDFYSCFPIAVFAPAIDGLGLAADDPRGLTVTGGLPFVGGPGNNYALHALAEMVGRLRGQAGARGLVGANGGLLSKYAALVLSAAPAPWAGWSACTAAEPPAPPLADQPQGAGRIASYTIHYTRGAPALGVAVGQLANGQRFVANPADAATLARMVADDPLGAPVQLCAIEGKGQFVFGT